MFLFLLDGVCICVVRARAASIRRRRPVNQTRFRTRFKISCRKWRSWTIWRSFKWTSTKWGSYRLAWPTSRAKSNGASHTLPQHSAKKKELELSLLPENAKSKRIENKVVCHTIVQKRKGNFQEIIEFVEVGNVRDTFFFHSYFTKIFQNVGSSCAPKCFLTVVIKLFQSR